MLGFSPISNGPIDTQPGTWFPVTYSTGTGDVIDLGDFFADLELDGALTMVVNPDPRLELLSNPKKRLVFAVEITYVSL